MSKDGVLTPEMIKELAAKVVNQGGSVKAPVLSPDQYDRAAYMVQCNFKNWQQFEVPALVDCYWVEFKNAMPDAYSNFTRRDWGKK